MKKVIKFPIVKQAPVKQQVLPTADLEYIQEAILLRERLEVFTTLSLQEGIPEDMHYMCIEASVKYDMAVDKMLKWAKASDPESYEKYLHKTVDEIREMSTVTAQRSN